MSSGNAYDDGGGDLYRRYQNYIFDNIEDSGDPLILLLARTPVASAYRAGNKFKDYTSKRHILLATFLHRLGLRGTSRWR